MNSIILLDGRYHDYTQGFEVQAPVPLWCSWGLSYEQVIALPCVEWDALFDDDYETAQHYYFRHPVRIGNLLCTRLRFSLTYDQRGDTVVRDYHATGGTARDFQLIHRELARHLWLEAPHHPARVCFYRSGMSFFLTSFTETGCTDDAVLYLRVANMRDGADWLPDKAQGERI